MVSIDQSVAIRAGEELPQEALLAYLTEHLPDLNGPLTIEQFPSGFSNLTYLVRLGDRELGLELPADPPAGPCAVDCGGDLHVAGRSTLPADVDRLWMLFFGTPYGPFGIMDMVGLDVVADIEARLHELHANDFLFL